MLTTTPAPTSLSITRSTLIVIALLACTWLFWSLRNVVLLAFAATLVAVALQGMAHFITKNSRLNNPVALGISIFFLVSFMGMAGWMFGHEITAQLQLLYTQMPAAWDAFTARIGQPELDEQIMAQISQFIPDGGSIVAVLRNILSGVGALISGFVLALLGGIYLAAQPHLYMRGFLKLIPHGVRPNIENAMDRCAHSLRLWLGGQVVAMVMVGTLTGIGIWMIGLSSPLALGVIAGVMQFVPMAGPILSAIPAILLAFTEGDTQTIMLTVGLFILIQQIEGIVLTPLIYARTVNLPPALTLFALFAVGGLFGVIGILLAAPLTVVLYVMVQTLYVRDTIGEPPPSEILLPD